MHYEAGENVVVEGAYGHHMYIVISGEAFATKDAVTKLHTNYRQGDFFGELALMNDAVRAASGVGEDNPYLSLCSTMRGTSYTNNTVAWSARCGRRRSSRRRSSPACGSGLNGSKLPSDCEFRAAQRSLERFRSAEPKV